MNTHQKIHYHYKGITLQGNIITGTLYANNKHHAKLLLNDSGMTILALYKKFTFISKPISLQNIILFYQQLATLLDAGVPIIHAFDLLRSAKQHKRLDDIIITIKQDLESGKSLSSILASFPHYFDQLSCYLILAGEQSGTLTVMLKRLADYHEKSQSQRKKILQALLYPLIIATVALTICSLMLLVIIPRFVDLFSELHGTLPRFTQWVIRLSSFMRHDGLWILFAMGSVACVSYYAMQIEANRRYFASIQLKIPLICTIIQKTQLIRFTLNLTTLLMAGIPISDSLQMTAHAASHLLYTDYILALRADIAKGRRLHHALQKNPLFPILVVQMVKIGEESGNLPHMLEKIAAIYESELDSLIENLTQLLEPLIMVILGVLIGGLVIAMYLPIFKQGTLI